MREHELIARIRAELGSRAGRVEIGPGDDAAVVRADGAAVTSIDTVVEGTHFRLDTHSPADVGHLALATALSDLAAMGAPAGEAYVALTMPSGFAEADAAGLIAGLRELGERTGTVLAGGDVTSGPALVVTVAVTGWLSSAEDAVTRAGARAGELVGVTGTLGAAAAALLGGDDPALLERLRRPLPRLEEGRGLAAAGVSAMIDVSDGVATDADHIAAESGVRVTIELARLPLAEGVADAARAAGRDPLELAASGGDDYELLFTAPVAVRAAAEAAAPVTWLGEVGVGGGARLRGPAGEEVELSGYEHS